MIHPFSRTGLFLFTLVLAPMTFADGAVGAFTQTSGEVRILRGENYLSAETGVEVESQDIIETDKDASAQLDMEDGSVMRLGPETRLALSEYRLDSNKSVLSAGVDLLSGWLRFAVSKLKPSGNYAINTPLLTIGIRGTEGTIDAQDEQGGLQLHEGEVDVAGVGKEKQALPPVRVRSGEYIQRQRGQDFRKLPQPPPEFLRRLPPGVQMKLARRALDPRQRGLSPKVIRTITKEDAQHLLQKHPHMNERLHQRFKHLILPSAGFGGNVRERPVLDQSRRKADRPGAGQLVMPPAGYQMPRQRPEGSPWFKHSPPMANPPSGQAPDRKGKMPSAEPSVPQDSQKAGGSNEGNRLGRHRGQQAQPRTR